MSDTAKLVLILEKSTVELDVRREETNGEVSYVLEGIFCKFDVKNNNNRIYEAKEYLPHLEYLVKKIQENRLLGELDHPDKFETSLSRVSHIVDALEYRKEEGVIWGRIRLLDTPNGRIAKNLVDSKVPISISSRAAGIVESNNKVKIKRIFTYDIVGDPGFNEARLTRVNESLGLAPDSPVQVFDVTEEFPELLEQFMLEETSGTSNQTDKPMPEYVTSSELTKYMEEHVQPRIAQLSEMVSAGKAVSDQPAIEELSKKYKALAEKYEALARRVDENDIYVDYLAEELDKDIQYGDYLAEELDKDIQYGDYLAEELDGTVQYSEYIAEEVSNDREYTDYLAEELDGTIMYSEYIAEELSNDIEYGDYLAEELDSTIMYSEYIAEELSNDIEYGDYLAEELDGTIMYSEYIAEQADYGIQYTEHIVESINAGKARLVKESKDYSGPLFESEDPAFESLDEKIDSLLESAKKKRADDNSLKVDYPFLRILDEGKTKEFMALSDAKKQKVVSALGSSLAMAPQDVIRVWEAALAEDEGEPRWITEMPEEYRPIWESLNEDRRNQLRAAAKFYPVETSYQIRNFWSTRGLDPKPQIDINEGVQVPASITATGHSPQGYTREYMDRVAAMLDQKGL